MPDHATIPTATPATVARRGRIAALVDAAIETGAGATDVPTVLRLRAAQDALAAAERDPGHGISQVAAIAWVRESEHRAAEVVAAILGDDDTAREIALALVAHGFRAVLR